MPEMGEYVAGAWLKLKGGCKIVVYNQKLSPTGVQMNEVDVVGLDPNGRRAYFCEVATHLQGLHYAGGNRASAQRIEAKFCAAMEYAAEAFAGWRVSFMLWAPYVPRGILTELLSDMKQRLGEQGAEVQLIVNGAYTERIDELQELAGKGTRDTGEPFFRALQILAHLH